MIKVSEIVVEMLQKDEMALEALRAGVLNLSSYARKIQPQIEKRLYKPVKLGSIVTALSRIKLEDKGIVPLRPDVRIEDMSIKSPLCEITYEKTDEVLAKLPKLKTKRDANNKFFTITQGVGEVTIIMPENLENVVNEHFGIMPKGQYQDLVAITVRFVEEEYIEVPNMIYALVAALASKRINLIEIVSTFTEISFIVRQKDMSETVDILKEHFSQ